MATKVIHLSAVIRGGGTLGTYVDMARDLLTFVANFSLGTGIGSLAFS